MDADIDIDELAVEKVAESEKKNVDDVKAIVAYAVSISSMTFNGHLDALDHIKNKNPMMSSTPSETPLHLASRLSFLDIVKIIANHVKDLSPFDNNGYTPMHIAAFYNQTGVIKYYLDSSDIRVKSYCTLQS